MRSSDVEFQAGGTETSGYLAIPESGAGNGVVVIQEWWGLVPEIRRVCDRLASSGFVALAPDLYRGETTDQPDHAQQLMMALDMDQAAADLTGATTFLRQHNATTGEKVGTLGFCLGGGLSVFAASIDDTVGAAVSYYYVMPHGKPDFSQISAPVLMHFGTADDFVSVDDAEALENEMRDAGVDVQVEFYEGCGHAFFNDEDRLGTHNPDAANLSWDKSTNFLRENLA